MTVNSICHNCAVKHQATWPEGHCATMNMGECDSCSKHEALCDVSDWNWPFGRPKNWEGTGRD